MKPEIRHLFAQEGKADFHLHTAWTDFDHEIQKQRPRAEQDERILAYLKALKQKGYTLVRDAGGMTQKELERLLSGCEPDIRAQIPEVICCGGMISGQNCHDEELLREILSGPEQWVKIFAAGGIGTAADRMLEPFMDRETFFKITGRLKDAGKQIMVHTYGGISLDWAIEAGVSSVEHGVYMTEVQACALARNEILYVPTKIIYEVLAREDNPFGLPDFMQENAKNAVGALTQSIAYANKHGVMMAYGTDFFADPFFLEIS